MESRWWDERTAIPRFENQKSATLDDLELHCENAQFLDEASPRVRRRRIISVRELKERVLVVPKVWSREVCEGILRCLREEMSATGQTWHTKRHSAYSTVDFPLEALPALDARLRPKLRERVLTLIARHYEVATQWDLFFKDLFFVKYEVDPLEGNGVSGAGSETYQTKLELHRDGCIVSFNILLNRETDFEGGGTYFQHTDKVVKINQGDCVLHSGTVLHAGHEITLGKRVLLVGFVEASPSRLRSSVRGLYCPLGTQVALWEAAATATREAETAERETDQMDVEEDALRMLCLS